MIRKEDIEMEIPEPVFAANKPYHLYAHGKLLAVFDSLYSARAEMAKGDIERQRSMKLYRSFGGKLYEI